MKVGDLEKRNGDFNKEFESYLILPNFLNSDKCQQIISLHLNKRYKYAIGGNSRWSGKVIQFENILDFEDNAIKCELNKARFLLISFLRDVFKKDYYPINYQVTSWPEGYDLEIHKDNFHPNVTISSIIYLNDNYKGGETFFSEDDVVQPQVGSAVVFSGKSLPHGVKKINEGVRYTICMWFTDSINEIGPH